MIKMFNQQFFKQIKELHHEEMKNQDLMVYLYTDDEEDTIEEEKVILYPFEGVLGINQFENGVIDYIPYERIQKFSLVDNKEDEES